MLEKVIYHVFIVRLNCCKNKWIYPKRIFIFEHSSVSMENITAGDQILNKLEKYMKLNLEKTTSKVYNVDEVLRLVMC
jgi:hypothetical protein